MLPPLPERGADAADGRHQGWPEPGHRDMLLFVMTLLFRVTIEEEVHQVRVEVPRGRSQDEIEGLQQFVVTTAYLEHYGRLPKGVVNTLDS